MQMHERLIVLVGGGEDASELELPLKAGGLGINGQLRGGKRLLGLAEREHCDREMILRLAEGGVEGDGLLEKRNGALQLARAGEQGAERIVKQGRVRSGLDGLCEQIAGGRGFAGRGERIGKGEGFLRRERGRCRRFLAKKQPGARPRGPRARGRRARLYQGRSAASAFHEGCGFKRDEISAEVKTEALGGRGIVQHLQRVGSGHLRVARGGRA